MLKKEIQAIFNETLHMEDLSVFRMISSLNEAQQKNATVIIANRLYKMIVDKIDNMEFGEIEATKGDITKLKKYKQTKESIDTLCMIAEDSQTGLEEVKVIRDAFNNIEALKREFMLGFKNNVKVVQYLYNTAVLGVITDIGFMTAVCVEFIKNPNSTVALEITNLKTYKSKFYLVHENLIKFNTAVDKGEVRKVIDTLNTAKLKHESIELMDIDTITAQQEGFTDGVKKVGGFFYAAGSFALLGILYILSIVIIPIVRDLTYIFFLFRAKISDWFELQAELLNANAIRLRSLKSTKETDYKKVAKEQEEWAKRMHKIADMLAVEYIRKEKTARMEINNDMKTKVDLDEINNPSYEDNPSSLF